MPTPNQQKNQLIFQQQILKLATERKTSSSDTIDLVLTAEELKGIIAALGTEFKADTSESKVESVENLRNQLESLIGLRLTPIIRCNISEAPKSDAKAASETIQDQYVSLLEHHSSCVQKALGPLFFADSQTGLEKLLQEILNTTKEMIASEVLKEFKAIPTDASPADKQAFVEAARQRLNQNLFAYWFEAFNTKLCRALTETQRVKIYKVLCSKAFEKLYQQSVLPHHIILKGNESQSLMIYAQNHNNQETGAFVIHNHVWQPKDNENAVISHRYGQVADAAFNAELFKNFDTAVEANQEPIVYQSLRNQSLPQVFEAAHAYNSTAVGTGKFLWIQNISVDRSWKEDLVSFFSGRLNTEAALMADIALLYTLQSTLEDPLLKRTYGQVVKEYNAFLTEGGRQNFHASAQGKAAADSINDLKRRLELKSFRSQFVDYKKDPTTETRTINDDLNLMLKKSLLKIFTFNYHYQQSNASMVDALSGFLGKNTLIGVDKGTGFEEVQKRIGLLVDYEMQEKKPREETEPRKKAGQEKKQEDAGQEVAPKKHPLEEKSLSSLKLVLRRFLISNPHPPEELSKQLISQPDTFEKYDDTKAVSYSQQFLFKVGLKHTQKVAENQLASLVPQAVYKTLNLSLMCFGGLSLSLYATFAIYALISIAFPPLLMNLMLVSTLFAGASLFGLEVHKLVDYCRSSAKDTSVELMGLPPVDRNADLSTLGGGPGGGLKPREEVNPVSSELFDNPPSSQILTFGPPSPS